MYIDLDIVRDKTIGVEIYKDIDIYMKIYTEIVIGTNIDIDKILDSYIYQSCQIIILI